MAREIIDPLLLQRVVTEDAQRQAAREEAALGNPEAIKAELEHEVAVLMQDARLFPKGNRIAYDKPTLTPEPYYTRLSQLHPDGESLGSRNALHSTYEFFSSAPYAPFSQEAGGHIVYLYQRLVGVYQCHGRSKDLLAFVHVIDPGDRQGPGADTDSFLNKGVLLTPRAVVPILTHQGQLGAWQPPTHHDLKEFMETQVYGEMDKLEKQPMEETVPLREVWTKKRAAKAVVSFLPNMLLGAAYEARAAKVSRRRGQEGS